MNTNHHNDTVDRLYLNKIKDQDQSTVDHQRHSIHQDRVHHELSIADRLFIAAIVGIVLAIAFVTYNMFVN